MASYYKKVNETINPGFIADANKINDIQDNIDIGISSEISDLDGPAFVFDDTQDAFELSALLTDPIESDVSNVVDTDPISWLSLQDLYIRRKLNITKNEVYKITVTLKNTSSETFPLVCNLFADDFAEDSSVEPVSTYTVNVLGNDTVGTEYDIVFNASHLNRQYHYLEIDCTALEDDVIFIKEAEIDETTNLTIETSEERETWQTSPHDLYLEEYYANSDDFIFTIKDSLAIIGGEKIKNLDTHVVISQASGTGDRIDIVYLNSDGWLMVEESEISDNPVPNPLVQPTDLTLAHIFIEKDTESIEDLIVDQTDEYGVNRPRSQNERIRRLERRQSHDWRYNIPVRVTKEFDSSSEIYDSGDVGEGKCSSNIGWETDHIEITSQTKDSATVTLKQSNALDHIDTNKSTVDHSDHTNGVVTLPVLSEPTYALQILAKGDKKGEAKGYYVRSTTTRSQFLYNVFTAPKTIKVTNMELALGYMKNCSGIKLRVIDYAENVLVKESAVLKKANYKNVARGKSDWREFTFPSSFTIKKGRKYRIIIEATPETGKTSELYAPVYSTDYTASTKCHVEYRHLTYPHVIGYMVADVAKYYIPMRINATEQTYTKEGYLYSTSFADVLDGNVKVVAVDANIKAETGTSYKIEVSVDNGANWFALDSKKKCTFGSPGRNFMYRIKFYTSDKEKTPELSYHATKHYAIKLLITYSAGVLQSSGVLCSKPFDANYIINSEIGGGYDDAAFSRYQWLLTKINPKGGTIAIQMQYVDHPKWESHDKTYTSGDKVLHTASDGVLRQYHCNTGYVSTNSQEPGTTDTSYWHIETIDWENWVSTDWEEFENIDPEYHDYPEDYDSNCHNLLCSLADDRALYYSFIRYKITLTKENGNTNADSPEIYMLGAIMELA